MNEQKHAEIKLHLEINWDDNYITLAKQTHTEYINGTISDNEHYNIDEYINICKEIYLEKFPPPPPPEPEEPVVEEDPIVE